jgi:ergothioneine biosynthesis protein EgtB
MHPSTEQRFSGQEDELRRRFAAVRGVTMGLARPLSPEDCAIQSMPDASPVKWHLGHTTWFFETFVLAPHASGYRVFDPAYRVLFNSYYNAIGEKHPRPERGMLSRPRLEEVAAYRRHVDEAMERLLDAPMTQEVDDLVALGLNHEQQHQELILTDVKHLLSRNPLKPAYQKRWPLTPVEAREPEWLHFPGGVREIGHAGSAFAFDNEGPRHRVSLEPFELASHPVTHGEFMRFVEDGGYRRPELWLSAGWDAVRAGGWEAPLYWTRHDDEWRTFTLHGEVPLDPDAPVCHLSFFEADAFARWSEARLPRAGRCIRSRSARPRPPASWRRRSATSGSGRAATTRRIPASAPRPARSGSTTASSCATNMYCAADPAPPRRATSAPRTATSSPPTRAGSSPESGSPGTPSDSSGETGQGDIHCRPCRTPQKTPQRVLTPRRFCQYRCASSRGTWRAALPRP